MEVSTYKGSGFLAKELEDELMKFTMKSEDSGGQKGYSVKAAEEVEVQKNTDVEMEVEVNITECTKSTGNMAAPPEFQDLTESEGSSSFEESDSDVDATLDGFEASSDLDFDGFGDNFRRKKLTAHWRSFIQPIMWRCKWTELQIKKLQSIAQQYDRELEAHKNQKQVQLVDSSALIDGVKSLPFSRKNSRSDFIRRKKRKTAEASTDAAAYMSSHNLFSYFENKRNPTDGAAVSNHPKISGAQKANTDDEFWANDDLSSFVAGDGNDSLEDILRKIVHLQSQAGQLRSRVDRVISENAEKFISTNNLSLPIPPFNNSPTKNEQGVDVGTHIASQLMSEHNTPDAESNPDAKFANANHAHLAVAYRNVEDGGLIDNQIVKKEMSNFDEVIINPVQKKDVSVDTNEPDLPTADQPLSETQSIARITGPRSNRKRGRKRGGRRRTRRFSG